jgi:hypothetical protein
MFLNELDTRSYTGAVAVMTMKKAHLFRWAFFIQGGKLDEMLQAEL